MSLIKLKCSSWEVVITSKMSICLFLPIVLTPSFDIPVWFSSEVLVNWTVWLALALTYCTVSSASLPGLLALVLLNALNLCYGMWLVCKGFLFLMFFNFWNLFKKINIFLFPVLEWNWKWSELSHHSLFRKFKKLLIYFICVF